MAHVGEEHALGLVGRLGRVAGKEQFVGSLLELSRAVLQPLNQQLLHGDILQRSSETGHSAAFIAQGLAPQLAEPGLPCRSLDTEHEFKRSAKRGRPGQQAHSVCWS